MGFSWLWIYNHKKMKETITDVREFIYWEDYLQWLKEQDESIKVI